MDTHVYKLKPAASVTSFLHAVDSCKGEVVLKSGSGDILNLKSQLSKYLLLAAASDPAYLSDSRIICGVEDADTLALFFKYGGMNHEH